MHNDEWWYGAQTTPHSQLKQLERTQAYRTESYSCPAPTQQIPFKNNTKTVQQPYNNRTTTVQQPHKNRPKTGTTTACKNKQKRPSDTPHSDTKRKPPGPQGRRRCSPPATLRYGAAGEAGGLPEGAKGRPHPQDPKGGAGATPRHTAPRRGEVGRCAYPKGRPTPAGPQGRRRRHPSSSCATARRGRPEAYPKGRPYCQKSDPAPPEIGRGSKRALTHRAGKSNRLT